MGSINSNNDGWLKTAERFVGFIDIMGFKDLVARSTHEEIYKMMRQIEEAKKSNENIKWKGINENKVKSAFYSDSIILYSKDSSSSSADVMNFVMSGLTHDLISFGIPHKGAVAFGKIVSFPNLGPSAVRVNINQIINFKLLNNEEAIYRKPDRGCNQETRIRSGC